MLAVGDPVGSGLVPTLSKPGGNVTGVSAAFGDLAPKYVHLLRQLRPGISHIGFLGNAENPMNARTVFPAVQAATSTVGRAAEYFSATKPSEVPVALQAIARSGIQGLIVSADPVIRSRTAEIAQFVAKARVPSISFADDYVRAGGLLSYGPNPRDLGRHAAVYVSKIRRCETRRPPNRAAYEGRTRDQHDHRQSARSDRSAIAAAARGSRIE